MAGLAIQSRGYVWAVVKINKIRHDEHWHPVDGLIIGNCICQLLLIFVLNGNLLVAAPAFCLSGQSCGCSLPRTGMTIQALHPETYMEAVVKLNRLFRGLLG
jgi:hypothetical protein